jgi:fatty acid desaturase
VAAQANLVGGRRLFRKRDDADAAFVSETIRDYSDGFAPLRTSIATVDGHTYRELRSDLEARWPRVWAELAATIAAVAVVPVATARIERRLGKWGVLVAPLAAAAVGTTVHRLGHFLHEGAHFNVAPDKAINDRITNATVGIVVLTDVRAYRPIHMVHHRKLGQDDDPERGYFERLNGRFVFRGLSGARVMFSMRQRLAAAETEGPQPSKLVPLIGAAMHAGVVIGLLRARRRGTAVAWAIGVGGVYPLLNSTRQLLEHRDETEDLHEPPPDIPARALTRMFTRGPLSQIIGGVGFNRHLLHHWDASISYTRLRELEERLQPTAAGPILAARENSYSETLRRMWQSGRRR